MFTQLLNKISWPIALIGCLTLGLAPFTPPHLYEKIGMLIHGELKKPIDVFDLFFHAVPWLVLFLKISACRARVKTVEQSQE